MSGYVARQTEATPRQDRKTTKQTTQDRNRPHRQQKQQGRERKSTAIASTNPQAVYECGLTAETDNDTRQKPTTQTTTQDRNRPQTTKTAGEGAEKHNNSIN